MRLVVAVLVEVVPVVAEKALADCRDGHSADESVCLCGVPAEVR